MLPPMQLKDLPHKLAGFQCFQDRKIDKFDSQPKKDNFDYCSFVLVFYFIH